MGSESRLVESRGQKKNLEKKSSKTLVEIHENLVKPRETHNNPVKPSATWWNLLKPIETQLEPVKCMKNH